MMETIEVNIEGNETYKNELVDNSERHKENDYTIKEEQWITLQKMFNKQL